MRYLNLGFVRIPLSSDDENLSEINSFPTKPATKAKPQQAAAVNPVSIPGAKGALTATLSTAPVFSTDDKGVTTATCAIEGTGLDEIRITDQNLVGFLQKLHLTAGDHIFCRGFKDMYQAEDGSWRFCFVVDEIITPPKRIHLVNRSRR